MNVTLIELLLTLAAVATAIGVLVRVKPLRWLWRRNVTEPIVGLVQSAVRPMIEALDEKNTQQHADSQQMHKAWRDTVTERFDSIERKVDGIDGRTTNIELYLTTPSAPADNRKEVPL